MDRSMAQLRRTGTLEVGRVRDTDGFVISAAGMLSLFLWLLSFRLIAGRTVRQGRVLAPREHRVAACLLSYVGAVVTYAYSLA
jgi:formylmethanofuran dehydrogenase subunit A